MPSSVPLTTRHPNLPQEIFGNRWLPPHHPVPIRPRLPRRGTLPHHPSPPSANSPRPVPKPTPFARRSVPRNILPYHPTPPTARREPALVVARRGPVPSPPPTTARGSIQPSSPTSPVGADFKPPLFFPLYNSPHLSFLALHISFQAPQGISPPTLNVLPQFHPNAPLSNTPVSC